jgi:TolA-binding protein
MSGIEVPDEEPEQEPGIHAESEPESESVAPGAGAADEGEVALSQDLLDELLSASRGDRGEPSAHLAGSEEDVLSALENDARFGEAMERESREDDAGAVVMGPDALSDDFLDPPAGEEGGAAEDDFSAEGQGPAGSPEPGEPASASGRPRRVPSLEEAEKLLAELQAQPEEKEEEQPPGSRGQDMPLAEAPPTAFNLTAEDPVTPGDASGAENPDESGEDDEAAGDGWEPLSPPDVEDRHTVPRRRRHRGRRHPISVVRVLLGCLVGAGLLLGGWYGYQQLESHMGSPGRVYRAAEKLEQRGELREAARLYQQFVRRFPEHELRGDAEFNAAYLLYAFADRLPPASAERAFEEARQGLEGFMETFPNHPRATRAQIVRGMVEHELGNHQEAVAMLSEESLRLADPLASLPVLRTLGRSYGALGEYDEARSTFLLAAGLRDNPQPDKDYAELGDMYYARALGESGADERARDAHIALQHWEQALTFPGVPPTTKKELRIKMDAVRDMLEADREAERAAALDGLRVPGDTADPMPGADTATEATGADSAPVPDTNADAAPPAVNHAAE